jgi:hypothetical protein
MENIGDLVIVLSTFAAAAALWFQWSSARAAKRALALIRRDAPQREPGLTIEVLGVMMGAMVDVEIRLTNPAGAWNLVTALYLEKSDPPQIFAAEKRDGALTAPLVIAAQDTITGHVFFPLRDHSLRDGSVVVVDLDERIAKDSTRAKKCT